MSGGFDFKLVPREPHMSVLLAVYDYLGSDESEGKFAASDIPQLRKYHSHLGVVRASIGHLCALELLDFDGVCWGLTSTGAEIAHHLHSVINSQPGVGDEASSEWTPLTLERDSDTARSAIHNTTELLERVRGENGFASSEPEKHAATVWSLQAGLDAIENRSPSLEQVKTLLLTPMRWLSDKFAGAAIGALAKTAIQSLLHWLF